MRSRQHGGQFSGVVAERVPGMVMEEEGAGNLLFPASHCPVCQHDLAARENIPLVSWLVLRGRCRQCGTAIPLRLLMLELVTALFWPHRLVHSGRTGVVLTVVAGRVSAAVGDD